MTLRRRLIDWLLAGLLLVLPAPQARSQDEQRDHDQEPGEHPVEDAPAHHHGVEPPATRR